METLQYVNSQQSIILYTCISIPFNSMRTYGIKFFLQVVYCTCLLDMELDIIWWWVSLLCPSLMFLLSSNLIVYLI
uniref:Uncharacterized protein MANES_16G006500 n=1 Tax=Rhizophora mucronata TaxID=61149 RepID=A0A2P2K6W7_RHIMU